MSLVDIDGALVQGYLDMSLGLSTAYEGRQFEPTAATNWAAVFIVPASTTVDSLGAGGMDLHTGFMQIDFNIPPDKGRAQLITYAQACRAQFVAGKGFSRNSQYVRIVSTERSQIRRVDAWMRISVTVNWEAETIRPEI